MSFSRDFGSIQYDVIVQQYLKKGLDTVLNKPLTPDQFNTLFKYIIYVDMANTSDQVTQLERLLQHAKTHLPTQLTISDILTKKVFVHSNHTTYSAFEMACLLDGRDEMMRLFSNYLVKAKEEKSSPSFVGNCIFALQYGKDLKDIQTLLTCHSKDELNQDYEMSKDIMKPKSKLFMTAIHYNSGIDTIKLLLGAGCNPHSSAYVGSYSSESSLTPIILLLDMNDNKRSKENKKQVIDALKNASVEQKLDNPLLAFHVGLTPLMRAANHKRVDNIGLLLEFPEVFAAINEKESYSGRTALFHAILLNPDDTSEREEKSKAIIKVLLDHDASAEITDRQQCTCLMKAATSGPTLNIFEFLLDSLKNKLPPQQFIKLLNQQDENGYTVLNYLLSRKKTDKVKSMIDKVIVYGGKALTVFSALSTMRGYTALDFAIEQRKEHAASPDYEEIIELIVKQTPPNEIQRTYLQFKNAGHLLGFGSTPNDHAALGIPAEEKLEVKSEGFHDKFTFPLIIEALANFIKTNPDDYKDFQEIKEAFEATQGAYLEDGTTLEGGRLFERYLKNKMVVIPSGWRGHSITLALYQDKLIICNRGDGKHSDGGANVFQLDKTFVAQLRQDKVKFSDWVKKLTDQYSATYLMDELTRNIQVEPTAIAVVDLTLEDPELALAHEQKIFTEEKGKRKPKSYPLLTQEWRDYSLESGANLSDEKGRRANSCFLTKDALYQIDEKRIAKKVELHNFDQFLSDLKSELKVSIPFSSLFSAINVLTNTQLHLLKKIVKKHGGQWEDPKRDKKIVHYYKTVAEGSAETVISENEVRFQSYLDYINQTLTEEQANNFKTTLANQHKPPLISFDSKSQRHKTCSFSNKKSLVEPMLYFLNPMVVSSQTAACEPAKQQARSRYKHFTEIMRDQYVDSLLKGLEDAQKTRVHLVILGKMLDANAPMKQARILRQFNIVNQIQALCQKNKQAELEQFINGAINQFKTACKARGQQQHPDLNQKKLAKVAELLVILIEEGLYEASCAAALFKFNVGQLSQFEQVFQYLKTKQLLSASTLSGVLTLPHALDDCHKLYEFNSVHATPANQSRYGSTYTASIDHFVKTGMRLLTDNKRDPATIKTQLIQEAQTQFQHRHWFSRALLDALSIIASLGCVILYSYCTRNTFLLFSQAKTNRQLAAENLVPRLEF